MSILGEPLQAYLNKHCDPEPSLLQHISQETQEKVPEAHIMLCGHYQGRLLSLLSKLIQPKRILEIGTYTGYATLCLAEGLAENGLIHTIEINPSIERYLRKYFQQMTYDRKVRLHIGNALTIIPTLDEVFDLVFIDADKKNNNTYFELVIGKVRHGGLILIDNVLWKGKVYTETNDSHTCCIRELNQKVVHYPDLEKIILPIRDGLLLIRKK